LVNILTISNEHTVFDELNLSFSSLSYNFEYHDSWESIVDYLDSDVPDLIFLIEEDLQSMVDTLKKLVVETLQNAIPVICFTNIQSNEERLQLFKAGAFDIINLPIAKNELVMILKRYCTAFQQEEEEIDAGMQGRLEDFSVIDLIQTLEEGSKSAVLLMKRNGIDARIYFNEGQIVKAEYSRFENLAAILNLVGWIRGDFIIKPIEQEIEKDIELNNQQILFEAVKRIDTRAELLKQLPTIDGVLLISPDTDINTLTIEDSRYLKFFQGGNTIYNFLVEYDLDDLILLEKLVDFYTKKLLLTHEQFDSYKTDYEAEVEQKGLKGFFSKLIKKETKSTKTDKNDIRNREKTEIIDPNRSRETYDLFVSIDPIIINEFREKISGL